MKEKPILFSGPMVRAILAGTKTQTRRVVKPQPTLETTRWHLASDINIAKWMGSGPSPVTGGTRQTWGWNTCPYGQPGDGLWVRETWKTCKPYDPFSPSQIDGFASVQWLADGAKRLNGAEEWGKTRVSIHMMRWASRISLEISGVRVERLQDISALDAIAEGIVPDNHNGDGTWSNAIGCYRLLWESINGPGSWNENPWVWVVEFKRLKGGAK